MHRKAMIIRTMNKPNAVTVVTVVTVLVLNVNVAKVEFQKMMKLMQRPVHWIRVSWFRCKKKNAVHIEFGNVEMMMMMKSASRFSIASNTDKNKNEKNYFWKFVCNKRRALSSLHNSLRSAIKGKGTRNKPSTLTTAKNYRFSCTKCFGLMFLFLLLFKCICICDMQIWRFAASY